MTSCTWGLISHGATHCLSPVYQIGPTPQIWPVALRSWGTLTETACLLFLEVLNNWSNRKNSEDFLHNQICSAFSNYRPPHESKKLQLCFKGGTW